MDLPRPARVLEEPSQVRRRALRDLFHRDVSDLFVDVRPTLREHAGETSRALWRTQPIANRNPLPRFLLKDR